MFSYSNRPYFFNLIRNLFTSTRTRTNATLDWRTQIKQFQVVSQISTILLQRHNWAPLIRTLNLSSKLLTPSLFLEIIHRTQTHPHISLGFFNWAKSNLGFRPDLQTQCKVIQILIASGLFKLARPILDSLIQKHPSNQILDSLIQLCKGADLESPLLSYVVECYCNKGLYLQALEVYLKVKDCGHFLSVHTCNTLLNLLQEKEVKLVWCFYAAILRNGFLPDNITWSVIARNLCGDCKFEKIGMLLDMGICNSVMYNMIIDFCSEKGDFGAAFKHLSDMCNRKHNPGFSTYSSILDGACKYKDVNVIEMVIAAMLKKDYLPKRMISEYDLIIQKLSDLGKIYAADMFFKRACDENIELQSAYGCMLRALSNKGRVKEAIAIYRIIMEKKIVVHDSSCSAFVSALCKEDPWEEESELLKDMVVKGFRPCASELTKLVTSQCGKGRWKGVEELLFLLFDRELLPDSSCCRSLIEHYCSSGRIVYAIALHDKIEKLDGCFDVMTYNVLLNGLFRERRVEEAMRIFDYMRKQNLLSSSSFSIMISGLCHEKELRRAMKLHDEMLKLGHKPDKETYKRLISCFT